MTTPLTVIAALLLTACASNAVVEEPTMAAVKPVPAAVKLKPEQILATVNGKTIAKSALAQAQQAPDSPEMEDKMVEELIARELIAQDFNSKELSKDPELAERLENMLRVTYSQVASEQFIKSIKISDAELRKVYEERKPQLAAQQYKIRHILVDSQEAAKDVLAKLNKGAKFEQLVKKLSKDAGSKEQGGDLGWVDPRAMGASFAHALEQMKNGEAASQPIQSQFGWHVIMREDARTQPAPAFETIKDKLAASMRMEKFQEHIQVLKAKAVISKNAVQAAAAPAPTAK
ncbi:MAG: peptidylprolyl isomerase [Methylococcales bacterium]